MKLQLTVPAGSTSTGLLSFTGYGNGYVLVNGARHNSNLIVTPDHLLGWDVAGFDALTEAHFAQLAGFAPEVALLGTGTTQRFPHPRLVAPLARARIGLEVMDTHAACRTYNILFAESRRVLAALLIS
ncbi:MAG: Mth938-like domain-containing protein [Betaproteobacteria bacterium]|nr:Mth938-like domain-containing protein [Betaproteobacteria bacterium]